MGTVLAPLAETREHPLCNLPDYTAGVYGLTRQDNTLSAFSALEALNTMKYTEYADFLDLYKRIL
jgi:hypothetical protein